MSKTVAAHQPHFWPWLGYLDKWQHADVLIVLDDVDYPRQDFVNRNRILLHGREQWLTLPVAKRPRGTAIRDMPVSFETDWRKIHLETLRRAYPQGRSSPLMGQTEAMYGSFSPRLMDWCLSSMLLLKSGYAAHPWGTIAFASQADIPAGLTKTDRLVALCKVHGATHYLSRLGAKAYLDEKKFAEAGIEVQWSCRQPPGTLSALHYLLRGDEEARAWLTAGAAGRC
jgi:hypothetical protein